MDIDDLSALMDRYRQGKCSPEEKQIIEEWYDTLQFRQPLPDDAAVDASLDKVFNRLRESGQTGGPDMRTGSPDMRTTGPDMRIVREDEYMSGAPVRQMNAQRNTWLWKHKRVLASAAMVALAVGIYWVYQYRSPGKQGPREVEDVVVVSTISGELKKMVLSDGSIVQLNANSTIRYPRQFAGGYRQVTLLSGEAFFQVAPDGAHPFRVMTGDLTTTVLGTSFNIRSYGKDSNTVIALVSGKVQVNAANHDPLLLAPHDLLRYGKGSGDMERGRFDKEMEVDAWKQRAMNFHDASFGEIAFEIENMYNVPVVNLSNKKHWSYTGYFGSESVWEIIRTICITENLSYQFYQGHIILINKN